jgi:cell division protease FtsH
MPEERPKKPNQGPDQDLSKNGKPSPDNNLRFGRSMMMWLLIISVLIIAWFIFQDRTQSAQEVTYTEFITMVANREIRSIDAKDDGTLIGEKPNNSAGTPVGVNRVQTRYPATAFDGQGVEILRKHAQDAGVALNFKPGSGLVVQVLLTILPWVVLFLLFWFFILRQFRGGGGGMGMLGSFGRSRHRMLNKEHTNVTFADVAGIDEAKEELQEIVEFLKNPKRFQKLGGRIPRGVLLIGDPGVGKTLLAKAIAGEAEVPFFSISGSDFVEMFVGVGASRVRDLFKTAKEASPCIIFLDEIDAVGRRRGSGFSSGGHDEREQTLNAILVEMDGFDTNDQVIVIAATNRSDVLDPALTRPGRFDRQVYVPLPDIKGRYEILKVHGAKVKMGKTVDYMKLARQTPMFSGADLAAIINEAALMATLANQEAVEMSNLEEARDKIRFGKARRSRNVDEHDKEIVAWHEAGHALLQASDEDADPLHKVSIIARGRMGGASFSLPEKDRLVYGRKYMLAQLRICFGGRIAEELYCGDISTGATMDIQQATTVARAMVCDYGMSDELGPIKFSADENRSTGMFDMNREYSDKTAELIDREVHRFIAEAYAQAKVILQEKRNELTTLKDALIKYETLDGEDVRRILRGEFVGKPTVQDILDAEARKHAGTDETPVTPVADTPTPGLPQPG